MVRDLAPAVAVYVPQRHYLPDIAVVDTVDVLHDLVVLGITPLQLVLDNLLEICNLNSLSSVIDGARRVRQAGNVARRVGRRGVQLTQPLFVTLDFLVQPIQLPKLLVCHQLSPLPLPAVVSSN